MEFNQPLGHTTIRHPINIGDLTVNPADLVVVPDMSNTIAQCPPLAGGRTLDQPTVAIATTQILLAQQHKYYGNGEQPAVQVQHQPYSGPALRYLVSGRPVRYMTCNHCNESMGRGGEGGGVFLYSTFKYSTAIGDKVATSPLASEPSAHEGAHTMIGSLSRHAPVSRVRCESQAGAVTIGGYSPHRM
jgi:hypothetical protein